MEEQKNNKGLVWLIVILLILVLGLVGYIVYDKVLSEDKTHVNNAKTTTTTTKVSSEEEKEYIIKETKTSKTGINVTLEQKTNEDNAYIYISNHKYDIDRNILSDFYDFKLYENFIMLKLYEPVNLYESIIIYDYNGKKIFEDLNITIQDNDYLKKEWAQLIHYYNINHYAVTDTKIRYSVVYYTDSSQLGGDVYDSDYYLSCNDLKRFGESVYASRDYELEFDGQTFAGPKLISSRKIKETDVYKKALNECE